MSSEDRFFPVEMSVWIWQWKSRGAEIDNCYTKTITSEGKGVVVYLYEQQSLGSTGNQLQCFCLCATSKYQQQIILLKKHTIMSTSKSYISYRQASEQYAENQVII